MSQANKSALLRTLPQVEETLQEPTIKALEQILPHAVLSECVRKAIDSQRQEILKGSLEAVDSKEIINNACALALAHLRPSLRRVINATGVVVHTNLGRSALASEAIEAVVEAAKGYSTLEYDINSMQRGSRHAHVEQLICTLTGAEAAICVNNNAAAVMMVLNEFAKGHEAIVSRGELVEIGGSFRIPDIMAQSNATMIEVGATNKTHASDYANAISANTAMLLKVHPSNYRMIGFTESVKKSDLRRLADEENARRKSTLVDDSGHQDFLPVLLFEDLGSGAFVHMNSFGTDAEPTVAESLAGGCDLVSFSGDKLLGGPQAGIIVGSKLLVNRLKKNPLARALRLDKMTLAALEATLRLYLDPVTAIEKIPTLRMLNETPDTVKERASKLEKAIRKQTKAREAHLEIVSETARAGGGSLPMCDIETYCVCLHFLKGNAQACEEYLIQQNSVPVIARIKKDCVMFDARTIQPSEIDEIAQGVKGYFASIA